MSTLCCTRQIHVKEPARAATRNPHLALALTLLTMLTSNSATALEGDGRVLPAGATMAVGLDSAEIAELPAPTQYLLSMFPGAKAMIDDGRVTAIYGVPLARAATPAAAEAAFWAEHGDAFGISGLALRETRSHRVGKGKFTVYAYHQTMEGVPVEDSIARLVIRNAPNDPADAGRPGRARTAGRRPESIEAGSRDPFVVLASGKFLAPPPGGLAQASITPADAAAIAQSIPPFDQGSETWPAELVVTTAEGQDQGRPPLAAPAAAGVASDVAASPAAGEHAPASPEARLAWRIPLVDLSGRRPVPYTVFIDAANGQVLRIRLEELYADVIGTVSGYGTPGVDPDMPTNPPTELFPLEDLRVVIPEAGPDDFGFTTDTGVFTIPHGGSSAISVESSLADSRWFMIENGEDENAVTLSVALEDVLPPGPAHLVFNDSSPTEATTSQVNAYVQLTRTRRFWIDRLDLSSAPLDFVLRVEVNGNEVPCNAAFTYSASTASHYLTFSAADLGDNGCFNAAFSTILSHEYGHFVQRQLGLSSSDSIQEGLSDSAALLIHDTEIYAKNFRIVDLSEEIYANERDYRPGQAARSKKYPCYGSNYHECGKVLAGLWCDIRANLITEFGDPAATKTYLNQLFVDWAQITNGGANSNAAHPLTITEILIAADDDGDLSNGVPHYLSICSAGGAHKLSLFTLGQGGQQACQPATPASAYHTAFWTPVNVRTSEPSGENPAGVNPHGLAVADIDGDGLKDIALACEGNSDYTGSILIYWNNTAPGVIDSLSFDAPTVLYLDLVNNPPSLTRPAKIAIADMGSGPTDTTPDGRLDLVVTLRSSNKVRIYYRDSGARTFSTHAELTPLDGSTPVQSPIGLAVGDWDADGRQDIAVTGYVAFQGANRPVLAWFWGENGGYSTASLRMNRNIGTSDEEKGSGYDLAAWQDSPPTGAHRFAVTNYDLTQASGTPPQTPQVYVFHQINGRAYDYQTLLPDNQPGLGACPSRGISTCDLDADGRIDVIFTNANNGRLRWSPQLQNGSFDSVPTDPGPGSLLISVVPSIEGIATGYLSKSTVYPLLTDAFPDVVLGGGVDSNNRINPNFISLTHTGSSSTPFTNIEFFADLLDVSGRPYAKNPLIVDINDDGLCDVVITNFGTGGIDIWEGFSVVLSRNY